MGIQSFSLDVGQMTCGRKGEYVRLADHAEEIRVLKEALTEMLHCATTYVSVTRMKRAQAKARAALRAGE